MICTWQLFAQSIPSGQDLSAAVRRLAQGELCIPPGSTLKLVALLAVWLTVLLILTALFARDRASWFRGLVDVRRHFELLSGGMGILQRSKRPLWVVLAAAVAGWTIWLLRVWDDPSGIDEIEGLLARHENSVASFATAHTLAGSLNPVRAMVSLGGLSPLVFLACFVLFARAADIAEHLRVELAPGQAERMKRRLGTIWLALVMLAGYRSVVFLTNPLMLPVGGCLLIDSMVVPVLLLSADGLLLSWVATEFRRGLAQRIDWHPGDTTALVQGMVPAMIVCALSNPGRYIVLGGSMLEFQLHPDALWPATRWVPLIWGTALAQLVGLVWMALPGTLAARPATGLGDWMRAYFRLWHRAGGKLVGIIIVTILLNWAITLPIYWIFASMEAESWSLFGAASYSHYARLLWGLVVLGAVTHLASQELGLPDDYAIEATADGVFTAHA